MCCCTDQSKSQLLWVLGLSGTLSPNIAPSLGILSPCRRRIELWPWAACTENWQRLCMWFRRYPHGQTDRHTHTQAYSSQYFATTPSSKVIIKHGKKITKSDLCDTYVMWLWAPCNSPFWFLQSLMNRAHSFPRAAKFRAEPRNLAVAAELPCFRGISRNSAQTRKFRGNGHIP